MRDAFAAYGYGRLHYYATDFANFWNVELSNSIFPALVNESDRPVDLLICGLIAALFSHLYSQTMDSLQTECPSMGAECSRFIVGPAPCIAELEAWYNNLSPLPSHEQALQQISQLESFQHDEKSATPSVVGT